MKQTRTRLVVDGVYPRLEVDVTPIMLGAIGNICKACGGLCCKNFSIRVTVAEDENGKRPDWVEMARVIRDEEDKQACAFAAAHFAPVGYPKTWDGEQFHCSAHDGGTGLCRAYGERPLLCRKFVCKNAWFKGHPPSMEDGRMKSQAKGGYFEGYEPPQQVDPLWQRTIGRLIRWQNYLRTKKQSEEKIDERRSEDIVEEAPWPHKQQSERRDTGAVQSCVTHDCPCG